MDRQPELTEDDEEPKSRIKDIEGRAGRSGEEAQGGRGTGREWYDGTEHAVTTTLPDATNRSAKCAESLKNKSHPSLMARAHVSFREFMSKINMICVRCFQNIVVLTIIIAMAKKF